MPRRFTFVSPLIAALLPFTASALQVKSGAIPNRGIFGVELAGTDSQFYARADHVLSVSWQEYTTGSFIVSEVVVDMENSNQQIRIYSLRAPGTDDAKDAATRGSAGAPVSPANLIPANPLKTVEDKASEGLSNSAAIMPVKSYPATTHTHTVEYVVGSRAELLKFYTSFRDLLCAREVKADQGSSVAGNNNQTAFGTSAGANPAASNLTVNRIGGTLFSIQP